MLDIMRFFKVRQERLLIERVIRLAAMKGETKVIFRNTKFYYENLGYLYGEGFQVDMRMKKLNKLDEPTETVISW